MRSIVLVGALLSAGLAAAEEPSPAALMFGKKCGGCHSLGEGDRAGPDLLGVSKRRDRKWIETFIKNPGAAIDGGDAVANELLTRFKNVRMPEQVLTSDEFVALFAYIDHCGAKGGCKLALGKVRHASQATGAEIARGKQLFEGELRLSKEGPACIACHNVRGAGLLGGGTLAKDLTFAYARLTDTGITSALDSTPFPLMKEIYPKQPLSPDEAFALKAYLAAAARDGTPPRRDPNFIYLGLIGLFAALGTIGAIWSGRLRGVRRSLVQRGPA